MSSVRRPHGRLFQIRGRTPHTITDQPFTGHSSTFHLFTTNISS